MSENGTLAWAMGVQKHALFLNALEADERDISI
jgi:hypothetical protein